MIFTVFSCVDPCSGLECTSSTLKSQISLFLGSSIIAQESLPDTPTILNTPDQTTIGVPGLGTNWSLYIDSELFLGVPDLGVVMNIPYDQDVFQSEDILYQGKKTESFGAAVTRLTHQNSTYTLVSAPKYEDEYWNQGAVFIYAENILDPLKIVGEAQEQLGDHIFPCGDIDGDNKADALITSSFFGGSLTDEEAKALSGRVYVAKSEQWLSINNTIAASEFTFFSGDSIGGRLGQDAFCQSDIDGDNILDIIISAPFADSETFDASGAIYVLPKDSTTLEDASFRLQGLTNNAWLGWSMAIGDIDGDKKQDIVAGAPGMNAQRGSVYIWKGIDLINNQTFPAIEIQSENSRIGTEVQLVDINGDGFDDILIGEPGRTWSEDSTLQNTETGMAHIIWGSADLSAWNGTQTLQLADTHLTVDINQAFLGHSILSTDIDEDGLKDVFLIHNAAN